MDEFDFPNYDFDPRALPASLLAAIGLCNAAASQAVSILDDAIGGLLKTDFEQQVAITAHMTVPQRVQSAISLAEIHFDDLHKVVEFEDLVRAIEDSLPIRNAVSHDQWSRRVHDNQVMRHSYKARSEVEVEVAAASVEDLNADALKIYEAGIALASFLSKHELFPRDPSIDRIVVSASARKAYRNSRKKQAPSA